ncbi:uncharacterized protein VTP21DRAFT_2178 [Calcarisporiella thermophila]|uniref:uncharacterized protein n=1 Tax=Calcarisporiella thermophila TaxID=911321 RepID=UPI003742E266
MTKRSICVFCASTNGSRPEYADAARELATEFLKHDIGLVYGGGTKGLMGIIAQTIHEGGGEVLGVNPAPLKNGSTSTYGDEIIVKDMHERKRTMCDRSDGFIAIPGGFGTMEELLEIITWSQLSIHSKPVLILNVCGFFDPFLQWLDLAVQEGFIIPSNRNIVIACNSVEEIIRLLDEYEPPNTRYDLKWDMPPSQLI